MACERRNRIFLSSSFPGMSAVFHYPFPRLVKLFLYAIVLSQSLMATRTEASGSSSSFCPSESCSSAPVHKWACSALRTWLKAHGLSYSGMKKDELVAKSLCNVALLAEYSRHKNSNPPFSLVSIINVINHNDLFIGLKEQSGAGLIHLQKRVKKKMMSHLMVMRLHYCLKVDG